MRRVLLIAVCGLALLAGACGSSSDADVRAQVRAEMMADGATEEQVDCTLDAVEAAGIELASLTEEALGDDDAPPEAVDAALACIFGDEYDFVTDPGADTRGDNATLDTLWDDCEAGDGEACDTLYFTSPVGSEYETFGSTCGNRFEDSGVGRACESELTGDGSSGSGGATADGDARGDDPALDALWDDCEAGDGEACDTLYLTSPIFSEYETFGSTCGNRFDEDDFYEDGMFVPGCEGALG